MTHTISVTLFTSINSQLYQIQNPSPCPPIKWITVSCSLLSRRSESRSRVSKLTSMLRDTVRPLVSRSTPHVRCDSTRTYREGSHTESNAVSPKQCGRGCSRRPEAQTRSWSGVDAPQDGHQKVRIILLNACALTVKPCTSPSISRSAHKTLGGKRPNCETCQSAQFPSHQARRLDLKNPAYFHNKHPLHCQPPREYRLKESQYP